MIIKLKQMKIFILIKVVWHTEPGNPGGPAFPIFPGGPIAPGKPSAPKFSNLVWL